MPAAFGDLEQLRQGDEFTDAPLLRAEHVGEGGADPGGLAAGCTVAVTVSAPRRSTHQVSGRSRSRVRTGPPGWRAGRGRSSNSSAR